MSGDLTGDGYRGEYELAREYLDKIDCERMIVIPGNHDSRNVGYVHFEELFGERRSELHLNGVSILAVDSTEPDLDNGLIGRGRYEWIEERFGAHEAFLRIFVLHHHLLPVPGTGRERNVVHDAGDTLECLQRADVHLVLSGHKHVPYAWRLENLFVVNAGTVSTTRLRGKTKPCYNVIEARPDRVTVFRKYPFHEQDAILSFDPRTYAYEKDQGLLARRPPVIRICFPRVCVDNGRNRDDWGTHEGSHAASRTAGVGALLALAPAAQAATPFTAGAGSGHDLAVGSDGTGHVVWNIDEAEDRVGYCRVPAGGTACDSESTVLTFPGPSPSASSSGDQAQVFTPAPNKVVILASCIQCPTGDSSNNTYRFISTNNGADFAAPVQVGDLELNGQSAFINTSNVGLSVAGATFQGQNNSNPTAHVALGSSPTYVYDASVVAGPSATKAVYAVNDLHTVWYRVFTDPVAPVTVPDLNTAGNWSGSPLLLPGAEGNNDETMLSSGPNGVYLTYRFKQPTENRIGLRKFDPATNTFGGAVVHRGRRPDREQQHSGVASLAGRIGPAARGVAHAVQRQPLALPALGRRRRDVHAGGEPRHGRDVRGREGGGRSGRNGLRGMAEQRERDPRGADRPPAGTRRAGRPGRRRSGHHRAERGRVQHRRLDAVPGRRHELQLQLERGRAWPC